MVQPETGHVFVDTSYLLKTSDEDPAYITIKTNGWRIGSPEVMKRLADPSTANEVKPDEYSFRLSIKLETGDMRYREKLNTGMWVGSAARLGAEGRPIDCCFVVQNADFQQWYMMLIAYRDG